MPLTLLQTKFHIPTPLPTLVPRPRLYAKLNVQLNAKLTLVAAPAGSGKTTLICDWLRQTGLSVVWLSLDAGDNDLQRFLRYLIGALQSVQPALGQETLPLLQLPQSASLDELLTPLLNDLATLPEKLILVLDDYHVIEAAAIHQVLSFLLERLPPQLHLVITSRVNPPLTLARLRGRGELSEVRASDLRFTSEEAVAFFQHFSLLTVSPADLALLNERTEGWIVGLQLAALSLEHHTNVAGFVQNFSGSNRFVLDYLIEEVLEQRSTTIQNFLLTTSILERMCGPLCDALLEGAIDRPAHTILQELEHANLFIIALDDERYWYRYHHLFAGMLQQRLRQSDPAKIAKLHGRASLWFEEQGLLEEAVEHAQRAGELGRVIQLVEPEIRSLIMRGYFDRATRWLAIVPPPLIQERPRLLIAQAWLRLFEIPFGNIEAALGQAERILGKANDPQDTVTLALLAEIAALRAAEAGISGKPLAMQLAQDALRLAGPENLFVQSIISYALASFDWDRKEWTTLQQTFQRAITAAQATGNVIIAASVRYNFAMFHWQRGDLAGADALLSESEAFTKSQPNRWPWPIVDSVWVGRARLYYERNELESALHLLQEGIELAQRRRNLYVIIDGYLTLAWVYQAQGESKPAQAALAQASTLVSKATRPGTPQLVAAHQARLWLAQGEWERTMQWAETEASAPAAEPMKRHPLSDLARAAIYIAQGPHCAPHALDLLHQLLEGASEWASRRLQIYALQALAYSQLGQPMNSLQALKDALAIGETAGYVRLLVDQGAALFPLLAQLPATPYRDQLLAALTRNDSAPIIEPSTKPAVSDAATKKKAGNQSLIEPLSERELEVLRLVVADASNQAIADRLVITVGTVKNHMTSILGKLGVANRHAAIRRTGELGLL